MKQNVAYVPTGDVSEIAANCRGCNTVIRRWCMDGGWGWGGGARHGCRHQELLSMQAPGGDWLAVGAKFSVDLKPDSLYRV